jgi:hypothetical protein
MQRRLLKVYTDLHSRPYRLVLRYLELAPNSREVIEIYRHASLPDLVIEAIERLTPLEPTFERTLCELDDARFMNSKLKTRRYVANDRAHVYINSPHLTDQHTRQVGSLWIATNIGRLEATAVVSCAALAAKSRRFAIRELLAK